MNFPTTPSQCPSTRTPDFQYLARVKRSHLHGRFIKYPQSHLCTILGRFFEKGAACRLSPLTIATENLATRDASRNLNGPLLCHVLRGACNSPPRSTSVHLLQEQRPPALKFGRNVRSDILLAHVDGPFHTNMVIRFPWST